MEGSKALQHLPLHSGMPLHILTHIMRCCMTLHVPVSPPFLVVSPPLLVVFLRLHAHRLNLPAYTTARPETKWYIYFLQAMEYLHSKGVVHMALK